MGGVEPRVSQGVNRLLRKEESRSEQDSAHQFLRTIYQLIEGLYNTRSRADSSQISCGLLLTDTPKTQLEALVELSIGGTEYCIECMSIICRGQNPF